MFAIGIMVGWFGYAVLYTGLQRVQGCNPSLLSVMTPNAYTPCKSSSSSGSSATSSTGPNGIVTTVLNVAPALGA